METPDRKVFMFTQLYSDADFEHVQQLWICAFGCLKIYAAFHFLKTDRYSSINDQASAHVELRRHFHFQRGERHIQMIRNHADVGALRFPDEQHYFVSLAASFSLI